ncbi:uncharacterized protein LOC121838551 [Ixodes scapularis]|uniref:uncharacterized protein LOC121838551 n=1 Tax=Ixodes scapularis TaxID=6945 RepID=UPI001C393B2A|nr:uncharacterized protein LOC121838551 [Ixodes scapularis]
MTEGFKLAHSTAEEILSLMKVLFSASLQLIGTELEEELQRLDIDKSASTVLDMLLHPDSLFDCIFAGIHTQHQRENYVKAHLPYTEVKEVELQKPGKEKKSLCYIPVQQLLQNLLTVTNTYDSVVGGPDERRDNMLTDFCDAHYLQEQQQQLLKDGHENTIFLPLYTDELELTNPLGAAVGKHKILVVYFSILNLHARHRSKLSTIHLLLIVPYANVVTSGLTVVLAPLIEDLNFLKYHGLQVGAKNFGVSVVAIVGDNLSMHRLMGLSCSFSSGRISRFCLARYENLNKLTSVTQCFRRTALSHASHQAAFLVDPALGALYGITCRSPLATLEGFDVARQLPPDAMHDILEGGIAHVLKAVLSGLVESGTVKKEDLSRVADFPYGIHDRKSKPVPISDRILTRSGTLKSTASQKWCLFRLFPQLFGDLVREGDKHWQVYLIYCEIVDIILAEQIPTDCIDYLQVQITEFLRLFTEQYPQKHLKTKLHYLLHYPEFIYLFGPPRRYWAMRFEAKHSYFKGVASKVKNFKNIAQTLAHRHQLLQAYELGSNLTNQGVRATGVELVEIASLPDLQAILPQELQGEQSLSSVKTAIFNSCSYRVDDIFVITVNDKGPVFGKVHALFVASGLMVSGFATAAKVLGDRRYAERALQAVAFLGQHLYDEDRKSLLRSAYRGEGGHVTQTLDGTEDDCLWEDDAAQQTTLDSESEDSLSDDD